MLQHFYLNLDYYYVTLYKHKSEIYLELKTITLITTDKISTRISQNNFTKLK